MSYAAAIDQLSAMTPELFTQPGHTRRKFSLDEIGILLAALGNPHHRFPSVLIAGTNGKGSTAATLASILTASGMRAGLYTSPHLTRPNERIRINSIEITDDAFAALYFRIHDCGQQLVLDHEFAERWVPGDRSSSLGCTLAQLPSFFETLTAMAFLHFAEASIDIAVLEVGMGGRLDATNIVDPLLSIVTDISLDHTEWLGPTIAAIAREKAGILRPNGTLITLPQHPEANQILGEIATELGVRAISAAPYMPQMPPPISSRSEGYGLQPVLSNLVENHGALAAEAHPYPVEALGTAIEVASPLHGAHQHRNIALAIAAAVELATHHGLPINATSIEEGVRTTHWPARLEVIQLHSSKELVPPQVVLDVAHNPAGAWALRAALRPLLDLDAPNAKPATLIFGCLRDKPIAEMAQILFPIFDRVIFAPIHSPRATPMADLLAAAAATGTLATAAASVAEALELASISDSFSSQAAGQLRSFEGSSLEGTGFSPYITPAKTRGALAPEGPASTNAIHAAGTVVVAGSVYLVGEARALLLARAGVPE
jgi:dihydrofolate synthase/folylpolyglutamate synthase